MNANDHPKRRTRSENTEFVVASIKQLGLNPNPSSRLMRMHRVLTEANGIIPPDSPEFETALEAERDITVLAFVFDQAAAGTPDEEFRRLVRNTLKDSLLQQDDRTQSKGRDAQFELFVAAVCQNAGLQPVAREAPDVICHIEGIKFGIAAKRIKNVNNLKRHVPKAAAQIEKAGVPGVIALDTNVALNRDNERITRPLPDRDFVALYQQALQRFMTEFHDKIQDWVRGKGVRGIVVHDQQVRFESDGDWSLAGMTMWVNTARDDAIPSQEFKLFENHYTRGLPNVEEL